MRISPLTIPTGIITAFFLFLALKNIEAGDIERAAAFAMAGVIVTLIWAVILLIQRGGWQ